MWKLKQRENSYQHATILNNIGPQTTRNNPQNGQFYGRNICNIGHETKTFKNMGYEMALVEIQGSD